MRFCSIAPDVYTEEWGQYGENALYNVTASKYEMTLFGASNGISIVSYLCYETAQTRIYMQVSEKRVFEFE